MLLCIQKNPVNFVIGRLEEQFCVDEKKKEETVMKALQKASKFLSDYTSLVVIAIAVVTFFVPAMMGWVNNPLFVDPVSNKFTCQSIIIGIIMFSMGLTLTTEDFKILAQRPFDICIGAIAQYLKKNHYRTYWKIRYGILGQTMNLPGRSGRKISSLAYIVARRIVGFN